MKIANLGLFFLLEDESLNQNQIETISPIRNSKKFRFEAKYNSTLEKWL